MPINELPAREPGYRMPWPRADEDAEKLADLLTHNCKARARAAGTARDPHWRCQTCQSRVEISYLLDAGQWFFAMRGTNDGWPAWNPSGKHA